MTHSGTGTFARSCLLVPFGVAIAAGCSAAPPPTTGGPTPEGSLRPRAAELESKLDAIARGSGGNVAATVIHLPGGERASVNGQVRMPLMSVFKLPLSILALASVDAGRHSLSEQVTIAPEDVRPWVSPLAEAWQKGEKAFPLETVLTRVIQNSDNTAGDKLVTWQGGGAEITAHLKAMGIDGVDVAEQEMDIFGRITCVDPPPASGWTVALVEGCKYTTPAERAERSRKEAKAPGNGSTSDALAAMFVRLDKGEVLSQSSREWLSRTLEATMTGKGRLRAGLPPGTKLAHKTGTGDTYEGFNLATNDVGIAALPDGSRLVIAALTSGVPGDDDAREAVIAEIARAAYDAFTARTPTAPASDPSSR